MATAFSLVALWQEVLRFGVGSGRNGARLQPKPLTWTRERETHDETKYNCVSNLHGHLYTIIIGR